MLGKMCVHSMADEVQNILASSTHPMVNRNANAGKTGKARKHLVSETLVHRIWYQRVCQLPTVWKPNAGIPTREITSKVVLNDNA